MTFPCPDCANEHDPRPCAELAAACDCCSAIFASQADRIDALTAGAS